MTAEDSMLEISALSRPLHLGSLYNTRTDQLVPGFSIWKTEDIDKATLLKPQPRSKFQVGVSESFSEKTSLLDVNASVKLSFCCGLIEAGGSAHYLKSRTSSTRQCSVTLHYHKSTEYKELRISNLGSPNAEILEETDATHVVVGVLYGADAIMEFQETASDASNKQEIQGNLNMMIKKIPSVGIGGDGKLKMDHNDKEKVKNFICKFFGDFDLKENPSTYEEAVKVYKELPTLLGEKGEKAVPVKVWLYPLSKLKNTESRLKKMISGALVSEMGKVMDDFHQAEMKTKDLLEKSKQIKSEDLVVKLKQFQSSLGDFTGKFLQKMAHLIPAIRGGNMEETALKDLLKSQEASGFSGKEMNQWLDEKHTEINIVIMYIKKIQNYIIKPPGSELDSFLMDPDITDAFVFSFTSLRYEESYLKKISQAFENFKSVSTSSTEQEPTEEVPWFKRRDVKEAMLTTLGVYNKPISPLQKVISFIPDPDHPGASIRWYKNGVLEDPCATKLTRGLLKMYACDLTLDPNTAHRRLSLSEGNRKVTRVWEEQSYPDHPERFDYWSQVLCREEVSGRCYWEAEWSGEGAAVAVAYKSIKRKEKMDSGFGRNAQSWSLYCTGPRYSAWHNNNFTAIPVPPSGCRRVGVYLDQPAGSLSFYSVSSDTLTLLNTFPCTFTEPLYPGFGVYSSESSVIT